MQEKNASPPMHSSCLPAFAPQCAVSSSVQRVAAAPLRDLCRIVFLTSPPRCLGFLFCLILFAATTLLKFLAVFVLHNLATRWASVFLLSCLLDVGLPFWPWPVPQLRPAQSSCFFGVSLPFAPLVHEPLRTHLDPVVPHLPPLSWLSLLTVLVGDGFDRCEVLPQAIQAVKALSPRVPCAPLQLSQQRNIWEPVASNTRDEPREAYGRRLHTVAPIAATLLCEDLGVGHGEVRPLFVTPGPAMKEVVQCSRVCCSGLA